MGLKKGWTTAPAKVLSLAGASHLHPATIRVTQPAAFPLPCCSSLTCCVFLVNASVPVSSRLSIHHLQFSDVISGTCQVSLLLGAGQLWGEAQTLRYLGSDLRAALHPHSYRRCPGKDGMFRGQGTLKEIQPTGVGVAVGLWLDQSAGK